MRSTYPVVPSIQKRAVGRDLNRTTERVVIIIMVSNRTADIIIVYCLEIPTIPCVNVHSFRSLAEEELLYRVLQWYSSAVTLIRRGMVTIDRGLYASGQMHLER